MTKPPAEQTETSGRSAEVAALLAAAHAVLENRAFTDAASAVVSACRTILGADAGLVAFYATSIREWVETTLVRGPGWD